MHPSCVDHLLRVDTRLHGGVAQVDTRLETAGFLRLNLKYDELIPSFAFYLTADRAKAWCILIHVEASLPPLFSNSTAPLRPYSTGI